MEKQEGKGQVIFLNGTPSSRKRTLTRALQEVLEEPWWHLSLDDFCRGLPDRFWLADDGSLFESVLEGYRLSLRAMASAGNSLIAESVITPERLAHHLALFEGFDVLFVGVRCPLAETQQREQRRTDRLKGPIDLAVPEFDLVHVHGAYGLEVDTSTCTPLQAARRIRDVLATKPSPDAFGRLRARYG